MRQLFEELKTELRAGRGAVLVTIIASHGSTPRGAGSRMLVRENAPALGTVGGGAVEYHAQVYAAELLEKKCSGAKSFSLNRNQVADIGMVCGGNVRLYFQYFSPQDAGALALCDAVLSALEENANSWLILDVTDESVWSMSLYREDGAGFGTVEPEVIARLEAKPVSVCLEETGREFYCDPLQRAGLVYIFGGGHVAQELVPVLTHVGFRCVVVDDREAFVNPQVFPDAYRLVVGDLSDIHQLVDICPQDYVCVMTRGHQFDYYCQRAAMERKPKYLGVIGSRNKIRVVTEKLLADGFCAEEIAACHMPIGLNIGGETPAEIAISIAAELILARNGAKR